LLKKSAKISLEAKFKRALSDYDYELPRQRIALRPVTPRDQARLLVYSRATQRVRMKHFSDLASVLPARSVIVLNETRVVPARLILTKKTGGRVEILFLRKERGQLVALANKKLRLGEEVGLPGNAGHITVTRHEDAYYWLRPSFPMSQLEKVLNKHGVMPLPPYLKDTELSQRALKTEYQSVFARKAGAVAAPTASLHFTSRLLREIEKRGHTIVFVTLHVGLGTFSPLTAEQWKSGKLHAEHFEISTSAWAQLIRAKKAGRPIIAVGTTVARTLESVFGGNTRGRRRGTTQLFIRPGYRFKMVDGLITNFHVPKSSLLMLVAALIGRDKTFELYRTALKKKFRFLSFGDGMLLL
jgi:S-adenosylmethionine:tRNA ribosyltransferase-isomerase